MTEDWYFWSHRLPVARAARDAGFEIVVATRVRKHGERIAAEGFALRPIAWRRRGDGLLGGVRAIAAIARLYRAERPDLLHHVALKPVLFGALAVRLSFPRNRTAPARVAAIMGLGSGFCATASRPRPRQRLLGWTLRWATAAGWVVVQNPEDRAALVRLGVAPARVALIRGSGIDTTRFLPLPEPEGAGERSGVAVALVSRMLRSKGVLDAAEAVRRVRADGLSVTLLLAGPPDPDNPDSLDEAELRALAAEPGIEWLGRVEDVRAVWRRAVIALLPSTYGEGVPMALLEAAACGRPIIASDMPGCREAVRPGKNGLLVPPGDVAALAAAIAGLARDPQRRRAMGAAGRSLVERVFTEDIVMGQTLAVYRAALDRAAALP